MCTTGVSNAVLTKTRNNYERDCVFPIFDLTVLVWVFYEALYYAL